MRWKVFFSLVLALLLLGGSAVAYSAWSFYLRPASDREEEILVDVPPESTLLGLTAQLRGSGLRMDRWAVRVWSRLTRAGARLRVGEYQVQSNWPPVKILNAILAGSPRAYKLMVKEGQHIWDIEQTFAQSQFQLPPADFQALVADPVLLNDLEVPPPPEGVRRTLEGFLFPENYTYYKYDTPRSVVLNMLKFFKEQALPVLSQHPWGDTPEGRYNLLTLASIVEKESGDVAEQPIIASVYWNRINKDMRLQADPTTIYGLMPLFDGNLRKADLLASTPYNTYRMKGLPAGPIANPGLTALKAVVEPAQTNYLFFVSRNDGTHIFSEDYATHNRAVDKFQRRRPSRSDR